MIGKLGIKMLCVAALGLLAACGGRGGGGDRTIIQNKGSDTLVNVAQAWAEAYAKLEPDVAVAVTGGVLLAMGRKKERGPTVSVTPLPGGGWVSLAMEF